MINTIRHAKRIWCIVVAVSAGACVTSTPRVGHAEFLPVYGGPTYSPATGGYLAFDPGNANYTPAYVGNGGIAAAPVSKGDNAGNFLGIRAVRWSATSPPTELGGDPNSTFATGINSSGTVIGSAMMDDPSFGVPFHPNRPARWNASSTAATILDIPRDAPQLNLWTLPFDINDSGTAVGQVHKVTLDSFATPVDLGFRAGRWDAGGTALTELGHLGTNADGSTVVQAYAVNAAGAAAGKAAKHYADGSSYWRAVRWDASAVAATELQPPATFGNRHTTVAKAINDAGIVVGDGEFNGIPSSSPAIRWDAAGNATQLGEIAGFRGGYISDSPKALNNAGTAVGRTLATERLGTRALRWDGSSTAATELGHLGTYTDGSTHAYAMAINESGTAVGRAIHWVAVDGVYPYHAVYWATDDTRAIDLNTLIDPTSGWMLEQALDISDTGWIVGVGQFDPDGPGEQASYPRHFLMQVPATVPEPATAVLFGVGLVGLGMLLRRRAKRSWTVLIPTSLALLFPSFTSPLVARADIFKWEYINPADPSQGKRQSTMLAPDGGGAFTEPGANLSNRNLTMAYLIGANLSPYVVYDPEGYPTVYVISNLTGVTLAQADLTRANLSEATLTGANLSQANLTGAQLYGATLTGVNLSGAEVRGAQLLE